MLAIPLGGWCLLPTRLFPAVEMAARLVFLTAVQPVVEGEGGGVAYRFDAAQHGADFLRFLRRSVARFCDDVNAAGLNIGLGVEEFLSQCVAAPQGVRPLLENTPFTMDALKVPPPHDRSCSGEKIGGDRANNATSLLLSWP